MASRFTVDEVSEMKESFNLLNRRRDGIMVPEELAAAYRAFGFNPSEAEIKDTFREVDTDADNLVDFTDFLNFMGRAIYETSDDIKQDALKYAFRFFSKSDDVGSISASDIKTICKHFGENFLDEEIQRIIDIFDLDGNATLEYNEFIAMMTGARYVVETTTVVKKP